VSAAPAPGRFELRTALHRSVFARLVAVMLVMGAFLLLMVSGFYFFVVIPGLHRSLDRLVGEHARAIAESRPDSASARALADRLDMQVRFEGPAGTWATAPWMPTREDLRHMHHRGLQHLVIPRHAFYVVARPEGHYIFARTFGERFGRTHDQMLLILMLLMVVVFATAYLLIRRALRPLRLLGAGVSQLGEGRLDVTVPRQSDDEFGALTDAFNRMAERVRDMVRSRDRLLLDVSHELRSPLTRMKVALALLPDGPQAQAMAADVAEMETLVGELLEMERLREGHGLRIARHDLVAIVRGEIARAGGRAPGVRLGAAPPELWLEVDGDRVRTVFRNLIENAIKYALPDSSAVEIDLIEREDAVEARVRDDGPGIPEGDPGALFEPFVRLDPSRSKKTGGYGLGLGICRRIMEAHGGTIRAERNSPRGATFVLHFPPGARSVV
jgi:signal transduction histidine kinase